jgi:c-di-GMP-binding flagellar brake protein YcgR
LQLRINQQVILRRLDRPDAPSYATHVEDIDDQRVTLSMPTQGGLPVVLPTGELIRAEFTSEAGVYTFTTRVLGRQEEPVPVLFVQRPAKFERIQRRNYVRLEANLPIDYAVLVTTEATPSPDRVRSQTRDISGGGLLFRSPELLPLGTRLDVVIALGGVKIRTIGEVVRLVAEETEPEHSYWLGLRYVGIDERDREQIIRYIFDQQRQRRRRGLV